MSCTMPAPSSRRMGGAQKTLASSLAPAVSAVNLEQDPSDPSRAVFSARAVSSADQESGARFSRPRASFWAASMPAMDLGSDAETPCAPVREDDVATEAVGNPPEVCAPRRLTWAVASPAGANRTSANPHLNAYRFMSYA